MRVIVTGGAGFMGSHLTERLLEAGHEVLVLDDFFTGTREHLAAVADHPNLELIEHDIRRPYDLLACDRLYNLACPASPVHYQRDPIRTVQTSVQGMINALETARRHGSRVLQASTSEIYGDPSEHPQDESYWGNVNPIGPRACYDEGKRVAETLCFDYHRGGGVDVRVVRIFNTYGPRLRPRDGRVVSNFILQALSGEPITIYGEGTQTRCFSYVDDTVEGLIRMMDQDTFVGPVNLGNPVESTIRELGELIIELTGARSELVRRPMPTDDPSRRRPDITLARDLLGWEPRVALREGLEHTIAWFDDRLREDPAFASDGQAP